MSKRFGDVEVLPFLAIDDDDPAVQGTLIEYVHYTFHRLWPMDDCPGEKERCEFCPGTIMQWGGTILHKHYPGCPEIPDE